MTIHAHNCTLAGKYDFTSGVSNVQQIFVAVEVNGIWGKATPLRGAVSLNKGLFDDVNALSCPAAG